MKLSIHSNVNERIFFVVLMDESKPETEKYSLLFIVLKKDATDSVSELS